MDLLKDRLFIGTLCLTVGLTAAAGVALAYDINSNRGQTVAAVSGGTAQDEQVTAGADTSGAQPQAQAQVATPQAGTSHRTATVLE